MTTRRNFIKQSCMACMGLTALGSLVSACGSSRAVIHPTWTQEALQISLDAFLTASAVVVRHKNVEYDILVVKEATQYTALQMRCTHNDIGLTYAGKKLICSAHGSEFDLHGQVLKAPASRNLHSYRTSVQDQQLLVHLH